MLDDANNVRGMTSACSFGMVGMYRPILKGGDCLFDEPRLVECISVDECLDVVLVTDSQTRVYGRWRSTPVFVQLETANTSFGLLLQRTELRVIAFAGDAKVER
jgi:hypothetical protein